MRFCPVCPKVVMLDFADPDTGLVIDSCPECYGLWFDGEELKKFFESPQLARRILDDDGLEEVPMRPRGDQPRRCPGCSQMLRPSQLGDVQLDYCLKCRGIWLDHGELGRVVELFRQGERGNLLIVNQLAEGLKQDARQRELVAAALWVLEGPE